MNFNEVAPSSADPGNAVQFRRDQQRQGFAPLAAVGNNLESRKRKELKSIRT